jgi:hypothetical protein
LKFPIFYGTRKFTAMFTRASQLPEGFKWNAKHQKKTSETVFFHVSTTGRIVDLE